tara:strand:- start:435 stop:1052 length:618 start_codon:yes stop_codon:yes gene_type:complete
MLTMITTNMTNTSSFVTRTETTSSLASRRRRTAQGGRRNNNYHQQNPPKFLVVKAGSSLNTGNDSIFSVDIIGRKARRNDENKRSIRSSFYTNSRRERMKTTIRANPENESMDETMKSLDDLLPPPEKPKREFPDSFYDDDPSSSKPPERKSSGGVSKEMRAKLLNESVGLGGVPGKAMPSNLFANIILVVLALVAVAYVGGIRP